LQTISKIFPPIHLHHVAVDERADLRRRAGEEHLPGSSVIRDT
jgi:hypothetical protein